MLAEAIAELEHSLACHHESAEREPSTSIAGLAADLRLCIAATPNALECEKVCSSRAFEHRYQVQERAEIFQLCIVIYSGVASVSNRTHHHTR